MLNYLRVIIVIITASFLTACNAPPEPTDARPEPTEPVPETPEPFELSGKWIRYAKLIPSTQTAFCRNLFNGTNLETFKFQNWIAEVDTLSRYGDNKYKVNLETPCSSIETRGKWTVLSENPIYSQLGKVEKGKAVFISGSYTVKKNSSTIDLNYFSIAW
jgi:hypothetical protein